MKLIKLLSAIIIFITFSCSKYNDLEDTNWVYDTQMLSFRDRGRVIHRVWRDNAIIHIVWMKYQVDGDRLLCTDDSCLVIYMEGVFVDANTLRVGEGDIAIDFIRQ